MLVSSFVPSALHILRDITFTKRNTLCMSIPGSTLEVKQIIEVSHMQS